MSASIRTVVSLVALAATLQICTAEATSICRWVDAAGRTQISDTVPARYQSSAVCKDSRESELSPQQRQQAQQQAARLRAEAGNDRRSETGQPTAASAPAAAASIAATKRPAQGVNESTDCKTWWRLYDESGECFGPYRTTRGATKAEAYDKCNVIPSPEAKCGPRRD